VEELTALAHREATPRAREEELRALMVRYQSVDAEAVEQLVRRISPNLESFFRNSPAGTPDAADLVQECWLRIHRVRHTYRPSEPLLPWIFAIARHTRVDGYRRMRRRAARELALPQLPEPAAPSPAARIAGGDVAELLDRLPESQREVLLLLKVSGMSLEEVARATTSTVGAVKQKAHRAYTKLRQLLQEGSPT
jgi:RNA polymerase sigma-70 factor (ECF subfamily)